LTTTMILQSLLFGAAFAKISSITSVTCEGTGCTGCAEATDCTCVEASNICDEATVDCDGWACSDYETVLEGLIGLKLDECKEIGTSWLKYTCSGAGGVSCFSSNSGVETKDGVIPMSDLHAGDQVRVGPSEFSEVVGFIHRDLDTSSQFLRFNDLFEVSEHHLVETAYGYSHAVDVKLGEELHTVDGPVEVTSIDKVTRKGYMAPLTKSGTIAVDGFMASNYAHVPAGLHWLADLMMYPRKCFTYESESTMDFYSWAMDAVLHPPFKAMHGGYSNY